MSRPQPSFGPRPGGPGGGPGARFGHQKEKMAFRSWSVM